MAQRYPGAPASDGRGQLLRPQDYLELTPAEARRQLLSVLARRPVTRGRQVDFMPVETLLCLAASFVVNHRRYGSASAHRAEQPVPALAALFRRPNSSVLAKMANLDGSRRNGARHELEVAARLLADPPLLAALYRLVLAAGREVGLDEAELPDFLRLEAGADELMLLGQEELSAADLEAVVEPELARWAAERGDVDTRVTERLLVRAARVGQHRFADNVLRHHGHRCVFCGLAPPAQPPRTRRLLRAGHIKPWRESTSAERLDHLNGLAACPTHDAAFDAGLFGVDAALRVLVAPGVAAQASAHPAARAAFGRPPVAERLLLPAGAAPPRAEHLAWHERNVYAG